MALLRRCLSFFPKFAASVAFFASLGLLAGCQDDDKIVAAIQVAADGKAAAEAVSLYFNTTAETLNAQCDMSNFKLAFTIAPLVQTKSLSKEAVLARFRACQEAFADDVKKLRNQAKSIDAFGNVYVLLASLATSKSVDETQAALSSLTDEINTATNTTTDPSVKAALLLVAEKIVKHKQAQSISEFAGVMADVPKQLAAALEAQPTASIYDSIYATYDNLLDEAVFAAYSNAAADATPELESFYSRIGVKLPKDYPKDTALSIFAMSTRAKTVTKNGRQIRLGAVNALKKVHSETLAINSIGKIPSTVKDDVKEIKTLYAEINSILHPASSANTK
ncbi:hypothetical protein ABIC71_003230 [Herbaspirillum seropedicae]|uniref:hypothetical protein n=1 Tax=Herbaspirillum seropedicae TaxID=964 RepID=UPI0008481294|nr:hypothetical protein [Herbaspirillum seropedicae]AON56013.1 hypothetical protein Hsc_3747 [Herbaspirillum seropedicae]